MTYMVYMVEEAGVKERVLMWTQKEVSISIARLKRAKKILKSKKSEGKMSITRSQSAKWISTSSKKSEREITIAKPRRAKLLKSKKSERKMSSITRPQSAKWILTSSKKSEREIAIARPKSAKKSERKTSSAKCEVDFDVVEEVEKRNSDSETKESEEDFEVEEERGGDVVDNATTKYEVDVDVIEAEERKKTTRIPQIVDATWNRLFATGKGSENCEAVEAEKVKAKEVEEGCVKTKGAEYEGEIAKDLDGLRDKEKKIQKGKSRLYPSSLVLTRDRSMAAGNRPPEDKGRAESDE